MKKTAHLIFAFFFLCLTGFSQSNKLDKKLEKAQALVDENKLTDAEKFLTDLLDQNSSCGSCWDLLAIVRMKLYKESKMGDNIFGGNITVTSKGKDGKDVQVKDDSLASKLSEMLNGMKPSK